MSSGVFVFASPVSTGHVKPLLPLARRLVERGRGVVYAISGDANEPAAAWRDTIEALGVTFVDLDATVPFSRGLTPEFQMSGAMILSLYRRIIGRAHDVAPGAAEAIRAAIGDRTIIGGVYDYFALWAYLAMHRLGVPHVDAVISAFPSIMDHMPTDYRDDPVWQRELAAIRATGFGRLDELRAGVLPADPDLRVLSFTSPRLCTDAPPYVRVLGIQREALPNPTDLTAAPEADRALALRLREARAKGTPVVLLSMGTVVTRIFSRLGQTAFLKRLYETLARSALDAGAIVVASTAHASPEELGVDEATLGPAARDRVIALPFVPQPLLFAHGLVDVMLMHGGANTFHEAIGCGIPLLICPGFGDQEQVSQTVAALDIGISIESLMIRDPKAVTIERAAAELPAMLAPNNRWRQHALAFAEHVRHEDGVGAAEALLLGSGAG